MKSIGHRCAIGRVGIVLLWFLTPQVLAARSTLEIHSTEPLTEAVFNSDDGRIVILLPPDLQPGDAFSGWLRIEPKPGKGKQVQNRLARLRRRQLQLGDARITIREGSFESSLSPANQSPVSLLILDRRGRAEATTSLPSAARVSYQSFQVPLIAQGGRWTRIRGPFDGNSTTTSLDIAATRVPILTESPRSAVFECPTDLSGIQQLQLSDSDSSLQGPLRIVQLELSANQLQLNSGQRTRMQLTLSGLSDLERPLDVALVNRSTDVVSIEGGNAQTIRIDPAQVDSSGVFQSADSLIGITPGGFSINASVDSDRYSQRLRDCPLSDLRFLLPGTVCTALRSAPTPTPPAAAHEEPPDFAIRWERPPDRVWWTDKVPLGVAEVAPEDPLAAVSFAYRSVVSEDWTPIGADLDPAQGWEVNWDVSGLEAGLYEILAWGSNQESIPAFAQHTIRVGPEAVPLYFSSDAQAENFDQISVFSVSDREVRDAATRASQTRAEADRQWARRDHATREYWRLTDQERILQAWLERLQGIDRILDAVPSTYRARIESTLSTLGTGPRPDQEDLAQAVQDARDRLEDCHRRLAELKARKQGLETERDDLKAQQDQLLEQLDALFKQHGFIGGYGYHPDGRTHWGYVGEVRDIGEVGTPGLIPEGHLFRNPEFNRMRSQLRRLNRRYRQVLEDIEGLGAEIEAAEKECAELAEALKQAEEAQAEGHKRAAAEIELREHCRQLRELLRPLAEWCLQHPDSCPFSRRLNRLLEECPDDSASWSSYWERWQQLATDKQGEEEKLRSQVEQLDAARERARSEAQDASQQAGQLDQEADDLEREADRLRRARQKELNEARRKAREAAERRRIQASRPQPRPVLDQPVEPSNDQLRFQAQSLFRELYYDRVGHGCDCKLKAIVGANNTSTIVGELIGGIGVAVAFAPLNAFPGLGLGARLGIGLTEALAETMFAGQSFPKAAVLKLFNVIGGELFPKLLDSDFAGSRLNDLAQGGLQRILEEEGIRMISWDGTSRSRLCGEYEVKTRMLFNPNTGWAVIMIQVPDCPLVVIKYRVNKDGVPQGRAIVTTVAG